MTVLHHSRRRAIACLLVLTMLVGALPMLSGVVVADSHPAFTLDICHPLQAAVQSSSSCAAPLIPSHDFTQPLPEGGIAHDSFSPRISRMSNPPDTPPPRPFVA